MDRDAVRHSHFRLPPALVVAPCDASTEKIPFVYTSARSICGAQASIGGVCSLDSHRPADHDVAERPWADLGHAHLARTSAPLKPQGVRSGWCRPPTSGNSTIFPMAGAWTDLGSGASLPRERCVRDRW